MLPADLTSTTAYSNPLPGISYINNAYSTIPLWTSRSMFSERYLQVEVLESEVHFEKSTDDIINMNTYECHICDTKVPKTFLKEHNNGVKHKTFLRIADIAVDRIRKHMKLDVVEPKIKVQVTETYYCLPCDTVIQNNDKLEHEKSKKHLKSLEKDEVLKEFLMIYEDNEDYDDMSEEEIEFDNTSNILEVNVPKTVLNNVTEALINEPMETISENKDQSKKINDEECPKVVADLHMNEETKFDEKTQIKTENKEKIEETQHVTVNSVKKHLDLLSDIFEKLDRCFTETAEKKPIKAEKKGKSVIDNSQLTNYFKTVTDKCKTVPIHTIEVLTDKLIAITAINGDKIKVPIDNFHSIHKQKNNAYCKICEDPNIGWRHTDSEEHMDKIMIPIEDQNGIRKLDDIWSHCIICNDLTKNINFHLQSLLHKNKLKHCVVADGTDINQNILSKPNQNTTQLIQEHSLLITDDNTEITCNICQITVTNKDINIREHINSFDHITNYNEAIEINRLTKMDDLQYYCVPCKLMVVKCYALGHCNGKKHNKNLSDLTKNEKSKCTQVILPSISQQVIRQEKPRAQTDSDLICFVCNVVLYNIHNHMNSLEHKKNYLKYLEANKLNEIEEDMFFCIPCNTVIMIDYLMNHCNSKKHKNLYKNLMSNSEKVIKESHTGQPIKENTHISRSITKSIQNQPSTSTEEPSQNGVFDTAIPLKHMYQFREMSNKRNLLCTICDEEVLYKKYEVQTHVNSIEHVVAFNLLMLWNKIKRKNDKYFCDICKVDVTYFNELSHIAGRKHSDAMAKIPKGTVYEYDKVLLSMEYAMSHKVGDRVRPSLVAVSKPKDVKK